MLKQIFEIQKDFQIKLFQEKFGLDFNSLSEEDKIKWTKEFILCLAEESFEVLRELKWKTHKNENKEINSENVLEESVDVFKYLLNIILLNGFTYEQFFEKFIEKSTKVEKKYNEEHN